MISHNDPISVRRVQSIAAKTRNIH